MLRKLTPHAVIIVSLMILVFLGIDRVNSMMNFINNHMTKTLLLVLSVLSIYQSIRLIHADREAERKFQEARRRALEQRRRAALQARSQGDQARGSGVRKS